MSALNSRAVALGLCGLIQGERMCNDIRGHKGAHSWPSNGWNVCQCGHAVVEHAAGRGSCSFCSCSTWEGRTA